MKWTVRFLLPFILVLSALAYSLVPLVDIMTRRWFIRDLDLRGQLLVSYVQEQIRPYLSESKISDRGKAQLILRKASQDARVLALAVCNAKNQLLLKTPSFPARIACTDVAELPPLAGTVRVVDGGEVHVAFGQLEALPTPPLAGDTAPGPVLSRAPAEPYRLLMVQDMSLISRRSADTKIYIMLAFLGVGILIAGIAYVVARWSLFSWVRSMRRLVRGIRTNQSDHGEAEKEFLPIVRDLRALVADLEASQKERDELRLSWDASTLKEILSKELSGEQVLVVANRQPYIHVQTAEGIAVHRPASGLVTAIEPILRACSGVWIAHGNGSADRLVVDAHDHVGVPPEQPQYDIHRLWLTREEEQGYYYGFANEGLWPLCHMAHTRPIFRAADWDAYQRVNQRFADAILQDCRSETPLILVQDYHFALVPRLVREKLPLATILSFWHIPWPNAESFSICPWKDAILEGLLGSSVVGFHTQFHCNNFIECIDRFLEARIDRETNSVSHQGHSTEIRPYPISIAWPPPELVKVPAVELCARHMRRRHQLAPGIKLGLGVDRMDYTKGIIERLRALERFFETHPNWRGRFSFIQIAAPSRTSIRAYQEFEAEVRRLVQELNGRFQSDDWQPFILIDQHREPEEVFRYMRAADLCLVTSLHDGMNLVAKEYVAARDDEAGVLILSNFTGASRELSEALLVNPYDQEQLSRALRLALEMPLVEQRERMRAMRAIVSECNVYRWAGRMLLDAARIRRRHRIGRQLPLPRLHDNRSQSTYKMASSKQPERATPGGLIRL